MTRILRRRAGEAMRQTGASAESVARNLAGISRLAAVLSRTTRSIRMGDPPYVDTITMRDVAEFFLAGRERAEGAEAAAAVRQEHRQGLLLWLGFLDADGEPLTGAPTRTYVAGALDPELEEHFGAHPVVIFS
ncbi:hypothetical protein [Planobispora takensis]|uniref:Uncharacterized protein n=1 Tax=Planobispora takensis TaxID=1367882 RepID=A0A8J3T5C5_9ACTN|nr:hypothetical protein [Planobispora takensis]GII04410.1 hypothetical protein Pta02_64180 [Planobispora takensis]